jgi:hypothetical protein
MHSYLDIVRDHLVRYAVHTFPLPDHEDLVFYTGQVRFV